ncbi:MAG: SdpI family protein [Ruminococcus sp.]|nr:SdpI family protein [Ruminococcus sp.]
MTKTFKRVFLITVAVALINLIATIIYLLKMPDTVPVHFNFEFVCDRVGSKWNGIFPSIILLFVALMYAVSERNGKNAEKNSKPMTVTLLIADFAIVAVNWLFLGLMDSGAGIGDRIKTGFDWIMLFIISFLFIILGNYMPTVRQNKTLGFKLPWTLKNEQCWNLTHRFGGKVMVIAGLVTLAMTMAAKIFDISTAIIIIVYVAVILPCMIIIPTIYAYKHRND